MPIINIKIFYHRLEDRAYIRALPVPKGLTRYRKKKQPAREKIARHEAQKSEHTRTPLSTRRVRQPVVTAMWVSRGATARGTPRVAEDRRERPSGNHVARIWVSGVTAHARCGLPVVHR